MARFEIIKSDALVALREMASCSIDAVVTDPPYGLRFMGQRWDYDVPAVAVWAECLRVLKPGGHLLAFAGTRTQHRMAVRIEDAGFEIRDMIAWVYGSGFPKSHNLEGDRQGWGTALKPALEPITMARKPLTGTVAANVLAHGTGALNIDGCRVPTDETIQATRDIALGSSTSGVYGAATVPGVYEQQPAGRWPANLIHDGSDEVLVGFPQTGTSSGGGLKNADKFGGGWASPAQSTIGFGDTGSAARFFYCPKASAEDRTAGNTHPTVKPSDLMAYLVRLVTPPDGIVLDPFMGSGSTGVACMREGMRFVGIERDTDADGTSLGYLAIAQARIAQASRQGHQMDISALFESENP